ncbi:MAG: hypothetical protein P0Y50_14855 [Candidatus Brevundimonas colombiensis]|uniref:Uncharacterized protein n=1 Tax=Candidatus Brevundimonas colombiensis TaxID=3121376 RepID=A0AAJ5X0N5_9CAUL|nr:hypothetical protein [Brevundimonas sp.]WEK39794.1 MAG: hypothetical protein P0Y50_14855 [Brevundimonas sp.]
MPTIATVLKRDGWILALNAVAMTAYVWAASPGLFESETRQFDVEYALLSSLRIRSVLPRLVIVGLIDVAWIIVQLRRHPRAEIRALVLSPLVICCGWAAAHVITRMFG